jgi:hypothetical protein
MQEHWAALLLCSASFDTTANEICCNSFMHRRFHRKKYDARKTPENFSVKQRAETDLHALNNELVSVMRETMQPAHVSLWLGSVPPQRRSEGLEQLRSYIPGSALSAWPLRASPLYLQ